MTNEFENFNDRDEEWLHELELRATDLENDLFDWREAHARELTDSGYGRDGIPHRSGEGRPGMLRAQARRTPPRPARPLDDAPEEALHHVIEDEEPDDELTTTIGIGAGPAGPTPGAADRRPSSAPRLSSTAGGAAPAGPGSRNRARTC